MGAIATFATFLAELQGPRDRVYFPAKAAGASGGRPVSTWLQPPLAGAAPTTAAVPTKATTGSAPFDTWQNSGGALQTVCLGGNLSCLTAGVWVVCDRLSHQGALSATVTGAQTTNLPTAALTRYTTGDGVMAGLEIHTGIGATATTVTASYTNQAGTAGQTTPAVAFGGTNFNAAGRLILLPLASGDTGVRAVANVNVAATTGTAGAFGVVLFKPLFAFTLWGPDEPVDPILSGSMFGGFPEILDDACLFMVQWSSVTTGNALTGRLAFAEV